MVNIKFPSLTNNWKNIKLDKVLLVALVLILALGLLAQSSVAQGRFFSKQIILILLGIPIFYLGYSIPTEVIKRTWWLGYGFSVLLLLFVLFKGTEILGAQRWLCFGKFCVQPSEPAKIAAIIALAYWFDQHKPKSLFEIIKAGFIILLIPFALIFKQPDLGTSMVLVAIFFSMVYWAGAKLAQVLVLLSPLIISITSSLSTRAFSLPEFTLFEHSIIPACSVLGIITICLICLFLAIYHKIWRSIFKTIAFGFYTIFAFFIALIGRPIAWGILKPYQQKRLSIFLDPQTDPSGAGYNIIQSLLAVGSGGLWGQGYKTGRLTQGLFVPEQHTDFIFSSIAEEWGFMGALVLLIVFATICFRLFLLIKGLDDSFCKLLVVGVLTFLCFHVCVNIGMNIGLMPVTGVPLPFISYGGTALWVCLFSLGITQRIYADNIGNSMFK